MNHSRVRHEINEVAGRSIVVFLSTLAVQVSTFLVVLLGGLLMAVEEFARLNLIVATAALTSLLLDFGLNVTMTKFYGETRNKSYILGTLLVRVGGAAGATLLGLGAWARGDADLGSAILTGAALSLWIGARAVNQAEDKYCELRRESLTLAALRILAALPLIYLLHDAAWVALLTYAAPVVTVTLPRVISDLYRAYVRERSAISLPPKRFVIYSGQIYIIQLAFSTIPYISLYFVHQRLTNLEVAMYGLCIAFLAPLVLITNSVRSVLLPRLVRPDQDLEAALCSRRAMAVLSALSGTAIVCCAGVGWAAEALYQHRYPGLWQPMFLSLTGMSLTGLVGMYSLLAHRQRRPQLLVVVNLVRLGTLVGCLWMWGSDIISIAAVTSGVMFLGEAVLAIVLIRGRRSE